MVPDQVWKNFGVSPTLISGKNIHTSPPDCKKFVGTTLRLFLYDVLALLHLSMPLIIHDTIEWHVSQWIVRFCTKYNKG